MDLNAPADLKLSPSVKSNHTAAPCSPNTGQASSNITTFEPLQPTLFEAMGLPLTLSAGASPARISARPAYKLALRESALAYGETTLDLLASYDHGSQSWRTSQHCLVEGLETFSETLPGWGLMRSGSIFQRRTSGLPTIAHEFGLLPTPRKSTGYTNPTLGTQYGAGCLTTAMLGASVLGVRPLPQFVEWMMGFPIGWTEVQPSEMPLSRKSRNSSAVQSLKQKA